MGESDGDASGRATRPARHPQGPSSLTPYGVGAKRPEPQAALDGCDVFSRDAGSYSHGVVGVSNVGEPYTLGRSWRTGCVELQTGFFIHGWLCQHAEPDAISLVDAFQGDMRSVVVGSQSMSLPLEIADALEGGKERM